MHRWACIFQQVPYYLRPFQWMSTCPASPIRTHRACYHGQRKPQARKPSKTTSKPLDKVLSYPLDQKFHGSMMLNSTYCLEVGPLRRKVAHVLLHGCTSSEHWAGVHCRHVTTLELLASNWQVDHLPRLKRPAEDLPE